MCILHIHLEKNVNNYIKDLLWVNAVFIGQDSCQLSKLEGNISFIDPTKQLYHQGQIIL